jgi:hypothetical protein
MVSPDAFVEVEMVEVDLPRSTVARSATLEREMCSRSEMRDWSEIPAVVGRAAAAVGLAVLSNDCTGANAVVTVDETVEEIGAVSAESPVPSVSAGKDPVAEALGSPLASSDAVACPQAALAPPTTTETAGRGPQTCEGVSVEPAELSVAVSVELPKGEVRPEPVAVAGLPLPALADEAAPLILRAPNTWRVSTAPVAETL